LLWQDHLILLDFIPAKILQMSSF